MTILILIIMTLGLGVLDRYIGWGGHGRVKPVLASVVFLAGIGYLLGWPILAWATFPLAFLIWRTPGWKTFGGSLTPRGIDEQVGTFRRHLLAIAFLIPLYYAGIITNGFILVAATLIIGSFAALATSYAIKLDAAYNATPPHDINRVVELVRGLTLGLHLSFLIFLLNPTK